MLLSLSNISIFQIFFIHGLSLSKTRKCFELERAWDCVCYIRFFAGIITGTVFLELTKELSCKYISQIKLRISEKSIDDFAGLNFLGNCFLYMPWYRTCPFSYSKCFLAMVVRRFTNESFNYFNLSLIVPFLKNAPVQSHSHSPKNPTSQLPLRRDVWVASLVIANQIKWCDIIACHTPTTQMLVRMYGCLCYCVCVCVCLSICLSVCLSVCLYVCMYVCMHVCISLLILG